LSSRFDVNSECIMLARPLVVLAFLAAAACNRSERTSAAPAPARKPALTRARFNMLAQRLDLPLFWVQDANRNGIADPGEVVSLLFYGRDARWVENGRFTTAYEEALRRIVQAAAEAPRTELPAIERKRRTLIEQDLAAGQPTLVRSDLRDLPASDKAFVRRMLEVARLIDGLHAKMTGTSALAGKVPADHPASRRALWLNWGPGCKSPQLERNPECSAIPGKPQAIFDLYPASLQRDPKFCEALERHPNAKALLHPFVVIREREGALVPVPYHEAYRPEMSAIARELRAAAAGIDASSESALKAYLEAAAQSFTTNDWGPADERWAKMNARNSRWYVRVGPDETYWEPCSHKAGFHLSFARVNRESLAWQNKLAPVQQEMENALAALVSKPYEARKVTFHLPDFIDIVVNAGDDRRALGATIGQSLPNWGKVANEGRGRTVAMSNLYTDTDSMKSRRIAAESLFTQASLAAMPATAMPGLLNTILHEATHNLGPAHEYRFGGKTDREAFGGGMASMLEELKAQTGALWYLDWLRKRGVLSMELVVQSAFDGMLWAFGQISRGMYTAKGQRKAYGQLAAIQVGFLLDEGVLVFDGKATPANGTDRGAFTLHFERLPAAAEKLMKRVGAIKATNDRTGAEALARRYVDGPVVPQKLISERILRQPRPTFVYALDL
jgi:hypothetical protein